MYVYLYTFHKRWNLHRFCCARIDATEETTQPTVAKQNLFSSWLVLSVIFSLSRCFHSSFCKLGWEISIFLELLLILVKDEER